MENDNSIWVVVVPLVIALISPVLAFWQDKKSKIVAGEQTISEKSLRIYFERIQPILEMDISVEDKADKLASSVELQKNKLYISPIIFEVITVICHIREAMEKSNEQERKIASSQLEKQVRTLKRMIHDEINRLRKNLGYPYYSFSRYIIIHEGFSAYIMLVVTGAIVTFVWLSVYLLTYSSGNMPLAMMVLIIPTATIVIPIFLYLLVSPHCRHSLMYWRRKHHKISGGTTVEGKEPPESLKIQVKKKRK